MRTDAASTRASDDRLYIVAPAETKLASTMQSQLMTGLLSARLSENGFTLKELPVEAPPEQCERDQNTFFVSLETLRHLREDYGLEAILVGNVYFVADERDPTVIWVRAAYLRLVDTGTLDGDATYRFPINIEGNPWKARRGVSRARSRRKRSSFRRSRNERAASQRRRKHE